MALVVSRTGENGSVSMNADAAIYAGLFDAGERFSQPLDPARQAYVHLARGKLTVNGHALDEGDGALLDAETDLTFENGQEAEVLVFDLIRD